MAMIGLHPRRDLMLLGRVRVHGSRDALRTRQRFERSLAGVEGLPPGISPNAVLLVRRLVPVARAAAASQMSFGDRISLALRHHASQARRPWLHADAAAADAVLFADEAELAACLVRDWLRGRVADRWWWRGVLGDLSPREWLRRHVLARGESMVPTIAVLAAGPDAAGWLARLDDAEADAAIAVVARSHAVTPDAVEDGFAPPARARDDRRGLAGIAIDRAPEARSAALERLIATVPEALTPDLRPPQRRLIALALALGRTPAWARTTQFAVGLQALERAGRILEARSLATRDALQEDVARDPRASAASRAPAVHAPPSPPEPEEFRTAAQRRAQVASPRAREAPGDAAPALARTLAGPAPATQAATSPDVPASRSVPEEPVSIGSAARVRTRFGGVFYLLNAALALELYADFTSPRGANLKVSPWDWLALVGRAWFGREFVRDPVWRLLAGLAGRKRRSLRRPRWLQGQLDLLHARLALALGEDGAADIPARVCRYGAEVAATAARVDVHLALSDLPLALRVAGLDRDPGWIPAAGRTIAFHFE